MGHEMFLAVKPSHF